jgi:FlaA1/EpsC-like NDP-sugar epimerase
MQSQGTEQPELLRFNGIAESRTAFVTGATGLLGSNLVRALLDQG